MLDKLVESGMDAARLNFSHGSHEDHAERALLIREAQARAGRPLALIADLQGPKLRIGDLPGTVVITNGDEVVLSGDGTGEPGDLPVSPPVLAEVLVPGQDVLIDDGLVHLQVEEVRAGRARCKVAVGGKVESHKGVNVPGAVIPIPSLTEKDLADLEFALTVGIDFVALSFVRSASDIHALRELLQSAGSTALVIAKIEKAEALEELEAIISASDAVMVARGDLGVEIGGGQQAELGEHGRLHLLRLIDEQYWPGEGGLDVSLPTLTQGLGPTPAIMRAQFDAEEFAHLAIEVGDVGLRSTDHADRHIALCYQRSREDAQGGGLAAAGHSGDQGEAAIAGELLHPPAE